MIELSLYTNPAVLYGVAAAAIGLLAIRLWIATDREYTKRAEEYWQTKSENGSA